MDIDTTIFLIAGTITVIVLLLGWELSGRWAYLTSLSARRLQNAEAVEYIEELSSLPKRDDAI